MPVQLERHFAYQDNHSKESLTTIPEDESTNFLTNDLLVDLDYQSSDNEDLKPFKRERRSSVFENLRNTFFDFDKGFSLVNKIRRAHGLQPLRTSSKLNVQARKHARAMARNGCIRHSVQNAEQLKKLLRRQHVGENVQCGCSVKKMHQRVMDERNVDLCANRDNILGEQFVEFGMAMARGSDGQVYLCQLFQGRVLLKKKTLSSRQRYLPGRTVCGGWEWP